MYGILVFLCCCCSFVCSFIHLVVCVCVSILEYDLFQDRCPSVCPSVFVWAENVYWLWFPVYLFNMWNSTFFYTFPLFCYHNFNIFILSPWGYIHMHVHMFATLQIITLRRSCLRPNICLGANLFYTIVLNCLQTLFPLLLESLFRYVIK